MPVAWRGFSPDWPMRFSNWGQAPVLARIRFCSSVEARGLFRANKLNPMASPSHPQDAQKRPATMPQIILLAAWQGVGSTARVQTRCFRRATVTPAPPGLPAVPRAGGREASDCARPASTEMTPAMLSPSFSASCQQHPPVGLHATCDPEISPAARLIMAKCRR